jgi:tetratricopeptide (TPR) repeat protein
LPCSGANSSTHRRFVAPFTIVLTLLATVGVAWAEDAPAPAVAAAMARDARARELFEARRFAEALVELEAAEAAYPAPSRYFNMARCHEELGHVDQAVELFQMYADDLDADPARAEEALRRVREARARLEAARLYEEPPGPRRRLPRRVFFSLLGVTAATAVAAVVLWGVTASAHEEFMDPATQGARFDELRDSGPGLALATDVVAAFAYAGAIATLVVGLLTEWRGSARRALRLRIAAARSLEPSNVGASGR